MGGVGQDIAGENKTTWAVKGPTNSITGGFGHDL